MDRGAHAAYALGDGPCVTRVAPDEDLLEAADHGTGAECVRDDAVLHHCFYAQVAFNTSYGIDNNSWHSSSRFLLIFGVNFGNHLLLADIGDDGVSGDPGERGQTHGRADGVCRALNAET